MSIQVYHQLYVQYPIQLKYQYQFFAQLPSLDDLDPDEELSDSHDANFETEDDSARNRFECVEWFGTVKKGFKTSIKTEWKKTCLKKEQRCPIFDLGKVYFCNIFEVTVALYIAIAYRFTVQLEWMATVHRQLKA